MRSGLVALGIVLGGWAWLAAAEETVPQAASAAELQVSRHVTATGVAVAHSRGITGAGVTLGILDSGIDTSGGAFDGRLRGVFDTNTGAAQGADDIGHGTKVAGMAAAAADGRGSVGTAPDAGILAIRVYDAARTATNANVGAGVRYALDHGARVLNLSFGSLAVPIAEQGVRDAVAGGALVVTAAGNYGGAHPIWPARFASQKWANGQVLAVGAVDAGNVIADFSNRAGDARNFYLVAPGVGVQTTCMGGGTCAVNGTSYAAPAVAGAAALIMGHWSYLTARQTADILLQTATDLGTKGVDDVYGRGLLNIERALQPVGVVKTYTRKGVAQAASGLQAAASGALGGALQGAASRGVLRIAGFDDFGRDYAVDLGAGLRTAPTGLLDSLLAGADRALGVSEIGLGSHTRLTTWTDRPLAAATAVDPLMLGLDAAAPRMQAMLLSVEAGAQHLSLGSGGLASQFFGVTAGTDAAWIGASMANPLFGMVGNHSHVGVGHAVDADTRLRIGLVSGANPLAAAGGLRVDPAHLWTAELSRQWGDTRVAIGGSLLTEIDGALGARGSVWGGTHTTQALQVGVSHQLTPVLAVAAQYTVARTRAGGDGDAAVLRAEDVVAQSWSLGLVARDVVAADDRLVLAVSQPLTATAGRIDLDASVGVDAGGAPVQGVRRIDAAGERPLQAELRYSIRLADDRSVAAALVHLDQGPQTDTAVTLKYTARF